VRLRALLALLFALPVSALAQGPSADWRTLRTPHFRVHYPAASEAWTRRAAARLESIRKRVIAEVGYAPPEGVDVVVSDPVADSNGEAIPALGWPRMILWTSPPGPESDLGHYTDWSDLLIVHEETHLVHLLRPSRNPLRQALARVAPVGPIPLAAPRWVMEGYATVIEGRLTGSGRPNSDLRAAILRRWAQSGKLPTYARLASDRGTWHGMSMAYLMGSAYLEWLEERAGPGSLRKLWARMTARTPRSFDDAFRGVFGESPSDLYDRFRAELTWRALESERRLASAARDGELWQDLTWTAGAPAVSPDGTKLVMELDPKDKPARLVVWSTGPNTEAETKREEAIQKLLARDPEDVPPVLTKPLARKPLHTLETSTGAAPTTPRWMADGRSILFVRFEPDPEGFLHPDLFRWSPESGAVDRLTHQADLRDPDPSPVAADPDWAVAVRKRDGASSIVRIDLKTGIETVLAGPSIEEVYDRPRISPDGQRIAYARHREGPEAAWRLVVRDVRDLASGQETEIAPPAGSTVSSPAWSPDGRTLYAVVGTEGFIDLWAFAVDGGEPVRLTRTQGAALSPAATPDGQALFYLSLESEGPDLRRLSLPGSAGVPPAQAAETAAVPGDLAPAVRPAPPPPQPPFALSEVAPSRPYGTGRQELLPVLGGSGSPSGSVWELGVRSGDVIGRLDVLALGSIGSAGWPAGGALAGVWRGSPVEVGLHLFQSREEPSQQHGPLPPFRRPFDLERRGAELSAFWDRQWSGSRLTVRAGVLRESLDPTLGASVQRDVGSLSGTWSAFRRWGQWKLGSGLAVHSEWGRTDGDSWLRQGGSVRVSLGRDKNSLAVSWRRDGGAGTFRAYDQYLLGGIETALLPRTATSGLIAVPAFPFATLSGTEHEAQRAELSLGFLPAPLFFERHRLWMDDGPRGGWLSLAGLEWRGSIGPLPIFRMPLLDYRIGVARVLDEPFSTDLLEGDTRWWVTAVWRP
jgi:Tol biopolymer transport system component